MDAHASFDAEVADGWCATDAETQLASEPFARTDVNPVMLNTVLHGLAASSQWTQAVVAVECC